MIKIRKPNGYGSTYKLSGKRRRPYVVAITAGTVYDEQKDEYRYKKKILGYFATQKEANKFLADYNAKGINPEALDMTLDDIWQKVKERKFKSVKESRQAAYRSAYSYLSDLHGEVFRSLKTMDIQDCIDDCQKGVGVKRTMKTILTMCYEFAMENDICEKNYAQFVKIENTESKIERIILSERVSRCEFATKEPFCDITLILIYTGLRVGELLKNNAMNFNADEMTLTIPKEIAKNKTSARTIPIHEQIKEPLERFFALTERPSYQQVYNWMKLKGFTPHSTRYTFATRAHECRMDELTIKRILGHSPDNITQKLYTKITIDEMRNEMQKLYF